MKRRRKTYRLRVTEMKRRPNRLRSQPIEIEQHSKPTSNGRSDARPRSKPMANRRGRRTCVWMGTSGLGDVTVGLGDVTVQPIRARAHVLPPRRGSDRGDAHVSISGLSPGAKRCRPLRGLGMYRCDRRRYAKTNTGGGPPRLDPLDRPIVAPVPLFATPPPSNTSLDAMSTPSVCEKNIVPHTLHSLLVHAVASCRSIWREHMAIASRTHVEGSRMRST